MGDKYFMFTDTQVLILAFTAMLFAVTSAAWIAFYIFRRNNAKKDANQDFNKFHVRRHKALNEAVLEAYNDYKQAGHAVNETIPIGEVMRWLGETSAKNSQHQQLSERHLIITVNEKVDTDYDRSAK